MHECLMAKEHENKQLRSELITLENKEMEMQ